MAWHGLRFIKMNYKNLNEIYFFIFDLSFGDLVMPWFLFMSGVSIRFALVSRTKKGLTKENYKYILN